DGAFPIVKRFHATGWLQGWRDGMRAHREASGLRRWRALGFRAPAPIEVRHRAGHWELVLEPIEGALPLPQFLDRVGPDRARCQRLASALGELLARLDESGFHQGDPHPGNVLVDPAGQPWLIDPTPQPLFSRRGRPGWARWVRLCAQIREHSSRAFRARVARAYEQARGPNPAPTSPGERARLETEARAWRHREVQRRTARWLRTSGATQVEGHVIHALNVAKGDVRRETYPSQAAAQSTWLQYARLTEHGIPCFPAKSLWLGVQPALESIQPTGVRPLELARDVRAIGHWLGTLHDRGLLLIDPAEDCFWTGPDGSVLVDPSAVRIHDGPPVPRSEPRFPEWAPRGSEEFMTEFLRAMGRGTFTAPTPHGHE
ncbi:MAG: hypothetical protein KDB61_02710, partial [Planctomycetes bacterium]|nr:hypothetical protein [Planctomycetota bacterium]